MANCVPHVTKYYTIYRSNIELIF